MLKGRVPQSIRNEQSSRPRQIPRVTTPHGLLRRGRALAAAVILILPSMIVTSATPVQAASGGALAFNGSSQYVTFGAAPELNTTRFTLEAWVDWTGGGVGTSTGYGGIANAIPVITKGRAEADSPANLNMDYFLGIDASSGRLVADFEDTAGGGNHPVAGTTALTTNTWHHVAATYDGTTWRLYLDGILDTTLAVGAYTPESTSIEHAALATAIDSTGTAAGFFAGTIDEARIWNVARTDAQIQSTRDSELTSGSGLIGRWGLDDGSGTVAADSVAGAPSGTLVGGLTWVAGHAFPADTTPPAAPTGLVATPASGSVTLTWTANTEADLAGYALYRSTSSPVDTTGSPLSGTNLLNVTTYTDAGLANGTTYHYALVAVDGAGNRSAASVTSATPVQAASGGALAFNGSSQYVTFGAAPELNTTRFTLEAWVDWTGGGVGTSTGYGGIANAIPVITKGRAEADSPANLNMDYFLGIDASSGRLVADFEDTAGGGNHPVAGTTALTTNTWHHVAATYDGTTWRLYLDGILDTTLAVGAYTPESTSIEHAALATAIDSTGTAAGFFAGTIDEARIWNVARTDAQIQSTRDSELTSGSGLIGRWGLDDGSGTVAADSVAGAPSGTLVGGLTWVAGHAFPADTTPPAAPTGLVATPASGSVTLTWTANTEADLAGYALYRSTSSPVDTTGSPLSGTNLLNVTTYTDAGLANGTTYHYALVAVDGAGNRSAASVTSATPVQAASGGALAFNGSSQYVTFGAAPELNTTRFTLEAWVDWTGGGVGTSTGYGGIANAIPVITKGRAEADSPANLNMDYFLGIDASSGRLVADFEDTAGGGNHPVAGTTALTTNTWHHVAATYDGTTWRLYLDGILDTTLAVGAYTPESTSIEHAALATAIDSTGTAAGFFAGTIDEARIWNVARTDAQIQSTRDSELTSGSGLIGRWGLDDGSGTVAADSVAGAPSGTLVGGLTWVAGHAFPADTNGVPKVVLDGPVAGASGLSTSPTLSVTPTDPEGQPMSVSFYGRKAASGVFTLIGVTSAAASGVATSLDWPGLDSGQRYEWYVAVSDGVRTAFSPAWTFSTQPGADPVLVGAGDIADCASGVNTGSATAAVLDGIAGNVFTAGDNTYPDGTPQEFATCYDPSWGGPGGSIKARTRPVAGNHDWNTGTLDGYFGYFGHAAAGTTSYYSYDLGGNWHVVVLDSECDKVAGGCGSSSPQVAWLRADLSAAANLSKNVIAIWHKPEFSSGDPTLVAPEVQPFWDAVQQYGVDIVINGHEHLYERMAPMDAQGEATANGAREFTVGTGGDDLMAYGSIYATSEARNNTTHGVLKLTLHATSYDWEFIPIAGQTFTDAGSQSVGQAANSAPVVTSATIAETAPATVDVLHATATATDADGDPLTYAYQWTRNGTDITGATGPTLDLGVAGNGDRGDAIRVRITASDGSSTSAPVTSSGVVVVDSAPAAGVTLDNHAPATDSVLTASATTTDADGDPVTLTYTWTVNGAPKLTTSRTTSLTSTFDLAVAGNGDPGDAISVTVTPTDGTASGPAASDSATVAADASPPAAPAGLTSSVSSVAVNLDWADNTEPDLQGYLVYRQSTPTDAATLLTPTPIATSAYSDVPGLSGTGYYTVKATDKSGNPSAGSSISVHRDIVFRGSASASSGSTASISVARPAASGAGDVLVATIDALGAPTINSPAGWVLVQTNASGTTLRQSTFIHVMGSTEPSSYGWTLGATKSVTAVIAAYGGVDVGTPVDVHGGLANASSTSITAPSVTTTVAGTLLVVASGNATNGSVNPATGLVEQGEVSVTSSKNKVATELADEIRPVAGATGTLVSTSTKAAVNIGQVVALRPASAPPPAPTAPTAPQALFATPAIGAIGLSWSPPASDGHSPVTGYRIYRGTTSGGETELAALVVTTTYVDSAVTVGQQYYYRVAALNAVGEGTSSGEIAAAPITVPGAPRGLSASAPRRGGINLSWSAATSDGGSAITGYRILRGTAAGQETLLATVGATTGYQDRSTTKGVRYYYTVLAINAAGAGAPSNEANATAR